MQLENMLLSATDQKTNPTVSMDLAVHLGQSKKWTTKNFREKFFMLMKHLRRVIEKKSSLMKHLNTRILRNDATCT